MEVPYGSLVLIIGSVFAAAALRAASIRYELLQSPFHLAGKIEKWLVLLLLATLVTTGFVQIVLRNFFHRGLLWGEPLMRHLVLWLGCLGGTLASSRMKHISIDVFAGALRGRIGRARDRVIYTAAALASSLLGLAALRLVSSERSYGGKSFLGIDTWLLQSILPVAFIVIAYRSAILLFHPEAGREPSEEERAR